MTGGIALNLLWLVPGHVGGSEVYTLGLVEALAADPAAESDLHLVANRSLRRSHPGLIDAVSTVEAPIGGTSRATRVAVESTWLPVQRRRCRWSLVHHMGGVVPVGSRGPSVLTVHDLQPLVMPEHFGWSKRRFLQVMLPRSVERADMVVTLTDYTRQMLCDRLAVPPDRVRVVPPGIPAEVRDRTAGGPASFGLTDRPYFLYPAVTWPHKNHEFLLRAFAVVAERDADVALVLTGGAAQQETALADSIDRLGLAHRVLRSGRVTVDELDELYAGATALVYPSMFEGFGLPILEAMARSCPVLAADVTALPEVVGTGGTLLPLEQEAWVESMTELLRSPAAGHLLATRGLSRAADFDWRTSAGRLRDVYREVVEAA